MLNGASRGVQTNGTNGVARLRGTDRFMAGGGAEQLIVTAASGAFTHQPLFMLPGTAGGTNQFPRLNALAALYSEYRWVSCTVRYKPVCPSTSPGRVVMSATYDPDTDVVPTVASQLLEAIPHVAGSVWRSHSLIIPCGRDNFQQNWYPCSEGSTTPTVDQTVPFVVQVGTDLGLEISVGYIEVDWIIDFKNPINSAMNPVS